MSTSDRNPVEALAEEFVARRRRGEYPQLSEYTERFPEWAAEIRDVFPTMLMLEELKPQTGDLTAPVLEASTSAQPFQVLGDYRIVREVGRGGMGIVYEAEQMSLARRVALKVLPATALQDPRQQKRFFREARAAGKLHHTNIVPIFGVGEYQGTNYYVMQFIQGQGLDKVLVELQRLRAERPAGESVEQSDLLKAANTGSHFPSEPSLDSPGVDTSEVAQAANDTDRLSFSAETSRRDGSSGSRRPRTVESYWRSVARLGLQASEALAYAHQQGVLHRDIKPANLLLDTHGTLWIADFGLAKLSDHEDLTRSGDIVGTLRYMPPEAFRHAGRAEGRADIYSLGLTLYELLALRPAFDATDRSQLMRQVMQEEPPRLRTLNSTIPRDLETIVHKAIEREPGDRYHSAAEMAEDLQRFLDDEPIRARPVAWHERLRRWARRHPGVAALSCLLALLLISSALASFIAAGRFKGLADARQEALEKEQQAVATAVASRKEAEHVRDLEAGLRKEAAKLAEERADQLYASEMQLAKREVEASNVERARELLEAHRPGADQLDRRGFEWGYMWQLCHNHRQTLYGHAQAVRSLAYSPDGQLLVTASKRTIGFWNPQSGAALGQVRVAIDDVWALAFSPDGSKLAAGGAIGQFQTGHFRGGVELLDVQSRKSLLSLPEFSAAVMALTFSPDGRTLATGTAHYHGEGATPFTRLAWIAPVKVGKVQLWNAEDGELNRTVKENIAGILSLGFSPDGQQLAVGCWDRSLHVVDLEQEKTTTIPEAHSGYIWSVAYAPDGKLLASGSGKWDGEGQIKLWNVPQLRERAILRGHTTGVTALSFSPDGNTLASASWDRTARLWDVRSLREQQILVGHSSYLSSVDFAPDGKTLATASWDSTVKLWYTDQRLDQTVWSNDDLQHYSLAFSPDDKQLLSGARDCQLIDLAKGEIQHRFELNSADIVVAYAPDGKSIAYGGFNQQITVRDSESGELRWEQSLGENIWCIAFSPDSRLLTSGSADGLIRIWETDSGEQVAHLEGSGNTVRSVTFSSDGRLLAAACHRAVPLATSDIKIWQTSDWRLRHTIAADSPGAHHGMVECVRFTPDDETLVSGSHDFTAKLWNTDDWQLRQTLKGHVEVIYHLAISPDGRTLATGSWDGTVKLWHLATGQLLATLTGHRGVVYWVAFSHDGRRLAVGSGLREAGGRAQKQIKFYHAVDLAAAEQRPGIVAMQSLLQQQPKGVDAPIVRVAHSPDGKLLACAAKDGRMFLCRLSEDRPPTIRQLHNGQIREVAFSSDSQWLASVASDGSAALWNIEQDREAKMLISEGPQLRAVAFSPDEPLLATAGHDKSITLWNTAGEKLRTFEGHNDTVSCLLFLPEKNLLASGSWDNTVRIWDIATGEVVQELKDHPWGVTSLALSPDQKLLAVGTGFGDPIIRLWNIEEGTIAGQLHGHDAEMMDLVFAAQGRLLVSCNTDRTIRLWDVQRAQPLKPILVNSRALLGLAKRPGTDTFAIADGNVSLIQLNSILGTAQPPEEPAEPPLPAELKKVTIVDINEIRTKGWLQKALDVLWQADEG